MDIKDWTFDQYREAGDDRTLLSFLTEISGLMNSTWRFWTESTESV